MFPWVACCALHTRVSPALQKKKKIRENYQHVFCYLSCYWHVHNLGFLKTAGFEMHMPICCCDSAAEVNGICTHSC